MKRNNKALCYHEAAHAIVMLHFGIEFNYVTVVPKDGFSGHVDSPQNAGPVKNTEHLLQSGVVLLAGLTAEEILIGARPSIAYYLDALKERQCSDITGFLRLINGTNRVLPKKQLDSIINTFSMEARKILINRWERVRNLAVELHRHKTLTYDQVVAKVC